MSGTITATGGTITFPTTTVTGTPTLSGGAVTATVNIGSLDFGTLKVAGSVTLNGSVGGNVNNAAGAALIQLTSGSGFFGPVPLSLTPIDLDALILDLASLNIEVDIPNLCLTCGPAGFIFPLTPLEGPVVVDLFTIDFSLVDAAGGAEGAYQASPYVSGER